MPPCRIGSSIASSRDIPNWLMTSATRLLVTRRQGRRHAAIRRAGASGEPLLRLLQQHRHHQGELAARLLLGQAREEQLREARDPARRFSAMRLQRRVARRSVVLRARGLHAYALRLSGTLPPLSASLVITCLCSHTFISAEPSSAPV